MELIRSRDWYTTTDGSPRGYIQAHQLRELWFHTGTACNLQCAFCLEGSRPGDRRLEQLTLADVIPFIDEAIALGVEQFSFTGGEPFVVKQIIAMVQQAAQHRPCLILTNGTAALQRRLAQVSALRACPQPVRLRVSIDSPIAAQHDLGRGEGMFQSAMEGLQALHRLGFEVSVARHMAADEDRAAVEMQYQILFDSWGLPEDTPIVAFPDFLPPGSLADVPEISEHCMRHYQTEENRRGFMCAFSRMVVKRQGRCRVYACTLVDDDPEYELGNSLLEAMNARVSMKHHRCYSCFRYGATCSEL